MSKLTPGHLEQIRKMRTGPEKKTYDEIKEFFQSTYSIKLFDVDIARAQKGESGSDYRLHSSKSPRKPRGKRGRKPSITLESSNKEDFAVHIHAAFNIHKKDFLPRVMEALASAE